MVFSHFLVRGSFFSAQHRVFFFPRALVFGKNNRAFCGDVFSWGFGAIFPPPPKDLGELFFGGCPFCGRAFKTLGFSRMSAHHPKARPVFFSPFGTSFGETPCCPKPPTPNSPIQRGFILPSPWESPGGFFMGGSFVASPFGGFFPKGNSPGNRVNFRQRSQ